MTRDRFAHLRELKPENAVTGRPLAEQPADVLRVYCDCGSPLALVTRTRDQRTILRFSRGFARGATTTTAIMLDTASATREARCTGGHTKALDPSDIRTWIAAGQLRHAV